MAFCRRTQQGVRSIHCLVALDHERHAGYGFELLDVEADIHLPRNDTGDRKNLHARAARVSSLSQT